MPDLVSNLVGSLWMAWMTSPREHRRGARIRHPNPRATDAQFALGHGPCRVCAQPLDLRTFAHETSDPAQALPLNEMAEAFRIAFGLIVDLDSELAEIVLLSLRVSLLAVLLASLIAFPLGTLLALNRFPGRGALIVLLNAMMSLPPVVVGLLVYLLLSRSGPLGSMGLLFTPAAMIIAQCILVTPIVAALTRQTASDLNEEYDDYLRSVGASTRQRVATLLWEGRTRLATAVLAGFGRAIAEVGAVMIVGGNILHSTRVMTTTIALETSRGNLALALGLGIILVLLAVGVNAAVVAAGGAAAQRPPGAPAT